jgi:glycosyltransferase involved in cell wall biosynthesis
MPKPELDILLWHVHGSWTTAFVEGHHRYLLPALPEGGDWGRGRCGRPWPASVRDVAPEELRRCNVDVVVLQRPHEIELVTQWLGRGPGRDVPAEYLEHNAPAAGAATTPHPLGDQSDIPVVHVTHFNNLMWDNGSARCRVIPHGIVDPGHLYTGELPRAVTMINEPHRRSRVTGSDLLPMLGRSVPIDVFGIGTDRWVPPGSEGRVCGCGDLLTADLHRAVARRRVFAHTARWTSLGLALIEAMHLGMPVVAVASTEVPTSVPPEAGVIAADVSVLASAIEDFVREPDHAALAGKAARQYALEHFGLTPFLDRWDELLTDMSDQ